MMATVLFVTPGSARGVSPLQGVWGNSYGSLMRIKVKGQRITGCYRSTTGSAGAYKVLGFSDPAPDEASRTTVLAVALSWRSYLGGKHDTSWHWTSVMSGQYFVDKDGEKLELVNVLNASTVIPGQNAAPGLYPETLTFKRYHDQSWSCPEPSPSGHPAKSPITGSWKGEQVTLTMGDSGNGVLTGCFTQGGAQFPVVGYYDGDTTYPLLAPAGIQAISLIVSGEDLQGNNHHSTLALVGWLSTEDGGMDLYTFRAAALAKYMSNKLGHMTLVKDGAKAARGTGVLVVPLRMGLARNNGATPWYGEFAIGAGDDPSAHQLFKFIVDTGTASTWVTSKACDTIPCRHHRRYNPDLSLTHAWIDPKEYGSELGPWGEFRFKIGRDSWHVWATSLNDQHVLKLYSVENMIFLEATALIDGKTPDCTFNRNWDDLVQDGSLAIPSTNAGSPSSQLLDLLMRNGYVNRKLVSYWTSRRLNRGEAIFGGLDTSRYDQESLRYYPVTKEIATADKGPEIWSVRLAELRVVNAKVELPPEGTAFVLDTGSSRFKGDPGIIANTIKLITDDGKRPSRVTSSSDLAGYPDLTIVLVDGDGRRNEYTLTADQYFQEFPDCWHLAFHPLQPTKNSSAAGMFLAGSIFLDHYYVVFDYTTDPVTVGLATRVDP